MCDQTEVSYLPNDIVWVKLGSVWWPGQVQDQELVSEDVTQGLKKKPLAIIKFFEEDTYEFIRNLDRIYHYNCLRKDEFIKKGLDLCRAGSSRDVPSNMKMFPKDIVIAEKLTGGNPKIIDDPKYLPDKKYDYSHIFGNKQKQKGSPKRSPRASRTPQPSPLAASPSPGSSERPITHPRIIQKALTGMSDYDSNIRLQVTPPREDTPVKTYSCESCDFKTSRINVLIFHKKSHIDGYSVSSPSLRNDGGHSSNQANTSTRKSLSTPKMKQEKPASLKRKALSDSPKFTKKKRDEASPFPQPKGNPSTEPLQKTPAKKRGAKTKEEKAAVLKKKNEAIRETLLKDWDEEDPVEEKEEIERLKLISPGISKEIPQTSETPKLDINTKEKPKEEEKPKEKSCFDFDDFEEESLNLNEPMKFGQKLPRVIADEKPKKQNEERNDFSESVDTKEKDLEILNDEFKIILEETKVPEIPTLPQNFANDMPGETEVSKESEVEMDKPKENNIMGELIDDDATDGTQIVEQEVIVFDDSGPIGDKSLRDGDSFDESNNLQNDSMDLMKESVKEDSASNISKRESDLDDKNEKNKEDKDDNQNSVKESCDDIVEVSEINQETPKLNIVEDIENLAKIENISSDNEQKENLTEDDLSITENVESAPLESIESNIAPDLHVKNEAEAEKDEPEKSELEPINMEVDSKEFTHSEELLEENHPIPKLNMQLPIDTKPQTISGVTNIDSLNSASESITTLSSQDIIITPVSDSEAQDFQQMDFDINSMPVVIEEDIISRHELPPHRNQNVSKIKIQLRKVDDPNKQTESEGKTESGQRVITIPGTRKPPSSIIVPSTQQSAILKKSQPAFGKVKSASGVITQKSQGTGSQLVILKPSSSTGTSKFTMSKNTIHKPNQIINQVINTGGINTQVLTSSQIVSSHQGKVYIVPSNPLASNQILKVSTQQKQVSLKPTSGSGTRIITNKPQVLTQSGQKLTNTGIATTKSGQALLLNKSGGLITTKSVILSKTQSLQQQSILSPKGVQSIVMNKSGTANLVVNTLPNINTKGNTGNQKLQLVQSKPTKVVMQGKSKVFTATTVQQQMKVSKVQTNTLFIKTSQGLFPASQASDKLLTQQSGRSNQISVINAQPQIKKPIPPKTRQATPNILQRSKRKQIPRIQKQQVINIPSTTLQPNEVMISGSNVSNITQSITPTTQTESLKMVYLIDEHGNYHQVGDQTMLSFNAKNSDNNTLYINAGASDGEKIIYLADQSANVVDILHTATTNTCTTTSQDILAKALANTQVLQSETTEISSNFDAPTFVEQQYPAPATLSHSVLETSFTLNQPIMTPLEVPSSVSPSGLSQISSAYLPVSSIIGDKQKSSEIQPSMPLLTDELEVPAQTVFLNPDIPVTSGSHLTLQLINDNIIVPPTSATVQAHYEEPSSDLSPECNLVIPVSTKISQSSESGPIVTHMVFPSSFNINGKEQKPLPSDLQTELNVQNMDVETENVKTNEFQSSNEQTDLNEPKLYKSENENKYVDNKQDLPPGSEYLNTGEETVHDNKDAQFSSETALTNLKFCENKSEINSDNLSLDGENFSATPSINKTDENLNEDNGKEDLRNEFVNTETEAHESIKTNEIVKDGAAIIEITPERKVEATEDVADLNSPKDGHQEIAEDHHAELSSPSKSETNSNRLEILNLPPEPIETETVEESEIYTDTFHSQDTELTCDTESTRNQSSTTEGEAQNPSLPDETLNWIESKNSQILENKPTPDSDPQLSSHDTLNEEHPTSPENKSENLEIKETNKEEEHTENEEVLPLRDEGDVSQLSNCENAVQGEKCEAGEESNSLKRPVPKSFGEKPPKKFREEER